MKATITNKTNSLGTPITITVTANLGSLIQLSISTAKVDGCNIAKLNKNEANTLAAMLKEAANESTV